MWCLDNVNVAFCAASAPTERAPCYHRLYRAAGLSVLITLVALVVDWSSAPVLPLFYLVTLFLLLSACFLGNCIYALKLIIDVASQEPVGRPGGREYTSPNLIGTPDKNG